jgi:RNA processing factor Prp31
MAAQGYSLLAIAARVDLHPKAVERTLEAHLGELIERRERRQKPTTTRKEP